MVKDKIIGDKGKVLLNGKVYYYKRNDAYVEILGERIADFFNLHHACYTPITYNGLNYYLSEDLNSKGEFKTGFDIGFESYDFNKLLELVQRRFNDNSIINDLYKMYFMDLMILNIDRNSDNYGFLTNQDKTTLYILDHGSCFLDYTCLLTSIQNKPDKSSLLEIDHILRNFDNEHYNMFLEMYKSLDLDTLKKLIQESESIIERELPFKDHYLDRYESLRERTLTRSRILRK